MCVCVCACVHVCLCGRLLGIKKPYCAVLSFLISIPPISVEMVVPKPCTCITLIFGGKGCIVFCMLQCFMLGHHSVVNGVVSLISEGTSWCLSFQIGIVQLLPCVSCLGEQGVFDSGCRRSAPSSPPTHGGSVPSGSRVYMEEQTRGGPDGALQSSGSPL